MAKISRVKKSTSTEATTTNEPDDSPDALLTVHQVAHWLQISPAGVRAWARTGHMPRGIKLGKTPSSPLRWRRGDIQAWLEEMSRESESA